MKVSKVSSLILLSFGLTLNLAVVSSATDYCDEDLCVGTAVHVACHNRGALGRDCSRDAQLMHINKDLRMAILSEHNSIRNKVAKGGFNGFKPAARMATMKWNNELAKIATYNVIQCRLQQDRCHNTDEFRYVGQALSFYAWSGKPLPIRKIAIGRFEDWIKGFKKTKQSVIDKYRSSPDGSAVGHFTQMIQEKATDIGCAILKQTKDGMNEQYMACNYAMANVIDEPVYKTSSRAASKCLTGVNQKYKYLCSPEEEYDVNNFDE